MTTKTQLGKKLAGDNAKPAPTKLSAVLAFGPRGEEIDLPIVGKAWVAPASHAILAAVEAAVEHRLVELKLTLTGLTAQIWESERAVQTLARCVRTVEDHDVPVGTPEEWAQLEANVIALCWRAFGEVVDRVAPLDLEIDAETRNAIVHALSKKNEIQLRCFGVAALASFMLSTASPPATSPTPTSSGGESSPES